MAKSFRSLLLGAVLFVVGPLAEPLHALGEKRVETGSNYPAGSDIAFEWQYSCTNGKGCSFNCLGFGGGTANVTKLAIQLGTIHLGAGHDVTGIFYEFSTVEIPRGNGFRITTGISTLSCKVNGMNLDYSGPPKDRSLQPTHSGPPDR